MLANGYRRIDRAANLLDKASRAISEALAHDKPTEQEQRRLRDAQAHILHELETVAFAARGHYK